MIRAALSPPADDGVALPTVMGTTAILMLFLLGTLGATLANSGPARADQDAKAAVAAAQAGIDEYVSRLNVTSGGYWEKGNTDPSNPAFTTSGTSVQGTGSQGARYRYRLLTTQTDTAQQGYITLEVVGTSSPRTGGRAVSRTLTAQLSPQGFLDFIYFTDLEVTDPDLYKTGVPATRNGDDDETRGGDRIFFFASPAQVERLCSQYYYAGRNDVRYTSGPSATYFEYNSRTRVSQEVTTAGRSIRFSCKEIQWTAGDVVSGPLHSNDALQVQGAVRFTDPRVESSWASGDRTRLWWGSGTPAGPTDSPAGYRPGYADRLDLPDGNQELLSYVQPKVDTSSNTDRPGCLYRGATRIRFDGASMKVLSPNTTDAPARCLQVASRGVEQTVSIPPVIYIAPATGACSGVGYPATDESTTVSTSLDKQTTDYSPCRGTAFVQGQVDGQVTVSAEDDIVVTRDLTVRERTSTDIIGLVAGNNVWVYHPVKSDGTNLLSSGQAVRNIEASILSLRHSFLVQNYASGSPLSTTSDESSKLRVYGAIGQRFRGPVGTGSGSAPASGYLKNYVYDPRLAILQPPYFLQPDNAPWAATQVSDG